MTATLQGHRPSATLQGLPNVYQILPNLYQSICPFVRLCVSLRHTVVETNWNDELELDDMEQYECDCLRREAQMERDEAEAEAREKAEAEAEAEMLEF